MSTLSLPTTLTEMDRLKLSLARERDGRLKAEAANLQMAMRAVEGALAKATQETSALSAELRERYMLEQGDEISEDGNIKRAPVRALPKEG